MVKDVKTPGAEVRRTQCVLMLDDEVPTETIQVTTGYSRRQIFHIRKQYLENGIDALADKRKGAPKQLLTKEQREEVLVILEKTTPKDHGYSHPQWTTSLLAAVIERKYQVKYRSKTSYYLVFKQAQFSYHKPVKVYQRRDEQKIQEWKKWAQPELHKLWKQKDIVILSGDEMTLTTETTVQKVWLKKGSPSSIEVSNEHRKRRCLYGFLNIRTGKQHTWKTDRQTGDTTVSILKKLRNKYKHKKIILFWDNAGWHKTKTVKEFIQNDGDITIIWLPPYAPELNPQEHVWKAGRSICTHNTFIENIDTATDTFTKYLNKTKFTYKLLGFSAVS